MAVKGIADKINQRLGASCVSTNIAPLDPNNPTGPRNCQVTQKTTDMTTGKVTSAKILECDGTTFPCFKLTFNSGTCLDPNAKTLFQTCNDPTCMAANNSSEMKDASIACAVQ
jgi:hypothetical protein